MINDYIIDGMEHEHQLSVIHGEITMCEDLRDQLCKLYEITDHDKITIFLTPNVDREPSDIQPLEVLCRYYNTFRHKVVIDLYVFNIDCEIEHLPRITLMVHDTYHKYHGTFFDGTCYDD